LKDYDKAAETYARLVEKEGHGELAADLATALNNRAAALGALGRLAEALSDIDKVVAIRTRLVEKEAHGELAAELARALHNRSNALRQQGRHAEALQELDKAAEICVQITEGGGSDGIRRRAAMVLNAAAWARATHPDAKHRDGAKAVRFAATASKLTKESNPTYLDTLAAAYAESGMFDEAIKYQKRAIDLAAKDAKAELQARLALYEAKNPYRQPANP
jgi:tetratricopeptide (TPR) repeat protein